MTKRYDEPIQVDPDPFDPAAPRAFTWRGHSYEVDQRLGNWREAGEWWNGAAAREREYYRVLARRSGALATGELDSDGFMAAPPGAVYDVYRDRLKGDWRIARVWD